MEDYSDSKVEEIPNLEEIDQIKETLVEFIDSTDDVQDDSIKEETVNLEKPLEIIDVSESGGYPVVPDISLNEQIEKPETSIENSVISDAKPDNDINVESESLVETDKVTEEIQESSTASSYENDSASGIDTEAKELALLTCDGQIEQTMESEETERVLVNRNEASLTATVMSETSLEVSKLTTNGSGEIPLGPRGIEETKFQVLDANNREISGPFSVELEGNVDDSLQATRAIAPVVDSSNEDGTMAKTADIAENKPEAVIFERKPCWASLLGCCGLSEAFHLSGK